MRNLYLDNQMAIKVSVLTEYKKLIMIKTRLDKNLSVVEHLIVDRE